MRFQSTLPSQGATQLHQRKRYTIRFQSTLPSQGATVLHLPPCLLHIYFNPRSPHRERLYAVEEYCIEENISIHAPLTGSDNTFTSCVPSLKPFQSTLPSQGATTVRASFRTPHHIFQSTLPSQGATIHG